jgi:hypothetical protein
MSRPSSSVEFITCAIVIADEQLYERNKVQNKLVLSGVKVEKVIDVSRKSGGVTPDLSGVDMLILLKSNIGNYPTKLIENEAERLGKPSVQLQHNVANSSWEALKALRLEILGKRSPRSSPPHFSDELNRLATELARVQSELSRTQGELLTEKARAGKLALSEASLIRDRDATKKVLALQTNTSSAETEKQVGHLTERLRVSEEQIKTANKQMKLLQEQLTEDSELDTDILSLQEELAEAKETAKSLKDKLGMATAREGKLRAELEKKPKKTSETSETQGSPDLRGAVSSLMHLVEINVMTPAEALERIAKVVK